METPVAGFAVRTQGLTKRYGRTLALSEVDLQVPPGVVFGYLGPNGAGKTTTIRLLMGVLAPGGGRAEVLGLDAWSQRDQVHQRVGYLPGEFAAYPDLTGAQYLSYLASLRRDVEWSEVDQLADRFDIDLRTRIGTLSHGNRQKLGLIQAFMHRPELLVLDEPTTGLDPLMRREFLALVREARHSGRSVFLSSHDLDEVEAVADLVGIIRRGRLVVVERVDALKRRAVRRIDLTFASPVPASVFTGVPGVVEAHPVGRTIEVTVEGSMVDLLKVAAPLGVVNVISHEVDLEEIFLHYYNSEESRAQ